MDLQIFLINILIGLGMGLMYSLMGIGLSLIYGVMKIFNVAQGELYTLGAYMMYVFPVLLGIPMIPSLVLSVLSIFGFSAMLDRVLLRVTHTGKMEDPFRYAIIVTIGLSMFLMNAVLIIFGPWGKTPGLDFVSGSINVGIPFSGNTLFAFGVTLILIIGLFLFLKKTWFGRALQATAQSKIGASVCGLNIPRLHTVAFAVSGALAAAAGALLSPTYFMSPTSGQLPIMKGWIIIVLGGMGSLTGSVLGGVILGVIEVLAGVFIDPRYTDVYGFIALILILVLRPSGLMGEKVRKA
jgi:branched-chain amino acid transport system permease protein